MRAELSSLERGLRILAFIQDRGRVTVADVCAGLGVPKSTVYRYVAALGAQGFLVESDGALLPSERLAESPEEGRGNLVHLARTRLTQLRDQTGLTSTLTVRVHGSALTLDSRRSAVMRTMRLAYVPGEVRPLFGGASVTPLLAYAPREVIDQSLSGSRPLTALMPSPEALRAELPAIRARGHHATTGWINPGLTAIGVPVLVDARCVCALSLVGPVVDPAALGPLQAAAAQLSADLKATAAAWLAPAMDADVPDADHVVGVATYA